MHRRNPFSRGVIGVPTVLIALAWLGLWALWPSAEGSVVRGGSLPGARVSYRRGAENGSLYRDPTIVAFPSRIGGGPVDEQEGPAEARPWRPPRPPRFLEPGPVPGAAGPEASAETALNRRALRERLAYEPLWPEAPVFSRSPAGDRRVRVEAAAELRDRGFEVPGLAAEGTKWAEPPWQVVVAVDIGEDGRPEHVFLETPCEHKEVNAAVVRMMYKGELKKAGSPCAGRVTVHFGAP